MTDAEKRRQEIVDEFKAYGSYFDVVQINLATTEQTIKYLRDLADDIEAGRYDVESASVSVEKSSAQQKLEVQMLDKGIA